MPMDEREMERIDMAHEKYYILLENKRFLAPIDPNLQRVLDLGCGTGRSRVSSPHMTPVS
jgi:predicted TPR repeat methyltransferase